MRILVGATALVLTGGLLTPAQAGGATHLEITTVVANVPAGDVFSVTVEALDAGNSKDASFNGSINLAAAAAGGSDFTVGTPVIADSGTATFTSFLANAADDYTLTATSSGLTQDESNTFDVTAYELAVGAVSNKKAGEALSVSVTGRDANADIAENFTGDIDLSAGAPGGSNFPDGDETMAAVAGTASLTNLVLNNAADGYTLTASSSGLTEGQSSAFDVTASHLAIPTLIGDKVIGEPFSATVEARDADDNVAENFAGNVTLSASAPEGSNFSSGDKVQTATAGVADFSNLAIHDIADGYNLTASATGVTSGESNSFDVVSTTMKRTASLRLRRHLKAIGALGTDGLVRCVDNMRVKIQRKNRAGAWKTVGTARTNAVGDFKLDIADRRGKYRAKAIRVELGAPAMSCLTARSKVRIHKHS